MRLSRILNEGHPISGFVYGKASFDKAKKSILIDVRRESAPVRSARFVTNPPSDDQFRTPRRFEFIGILGYSTFLSFSPFCGFPASRCS